MKSIFMVPLLLLSMVAVSADDMKPYPPPEEGYVRYAFRVPETGNDYDHKVEIVVGKVIPVDCNRTMFIGNAEELIAEGWGFPYHVVRKITGPATTLMACGDDQKADQFVATRGEGFLQRYNHKLPVVVYVPKGFEVRYRIWSAGEELTRARAQ